MWVKLPAERLSWIVMPLPESPMIPAPNQP